MNTNMLYLSVKTVSRKVLPCKIPVNFFSSAPQVLPTEKLQRFRTSESDCMKHSRNHLGLFYKISEEDRKHIFRYKGIPNNYDRQTKTFNETCVMIRQPSLDVINCLEKLNYSKPAVRFVLYGKKGCGKSLSLMHILHHAYKKGFLLVHVPWVCDWMNKCSEYSNSETREGFVDINLDAAAWLQMFKSQNSHLLSNPEAKTSVEYIWSKRETTPAGSNLLSLIDHGINRVKYASDTVVGLCAEIKKLTVEGVFRTLVVVDGFNAFFSPNTAVYTEKKEMVHAQKVSLTQGFMNLTKFDWNNAAVVVTVDELAVTEETISHLPRYLLGKEGFEHLDPFVPVPVSSYSDKELTSCMDYYRERRWVQDYPGLDEEIKFLSDSNPYKIMKLCASL